MNSKLTGHLACAVAYTIFGLNIVFCKDIANAESVSPEALFGARMILAAGIFWLMSLFAKPEKVPFKDVCLMALPASSGWRCRSILF